MDLAVVENKKWTVEKGGNIEQSITMNNGHYIIKIKEETEKEIYIFSIFNVEEDKIEVKIICTSTAIISYIIDFIKEKKYHLRKTDLNKFTELIKKIKEIRDKYSVSWNEPSDD